QIKPAWREGILEHVRAYESSPRHPHRLSSAIEHSAELSRQLHPFILDPVIEGTVEPQDLPGGVAIVGRDACLEGVPLGPHISGQRRGSVKIAARARDFQAKLLATGLDAVRDS